MSDMENDTSLFDFEWEITLDDELIQLETFVYWKVTTVEENDILRRHAGYPTEETVAHLKRIAGRYQRGELAVLLPVVGPLLQDEQSRDLAADFLATLEEQDDENVRLVHRLALGWAEETGIPMPSDAPPIDERPMDLIPIEYPWPDMKSTAIH